MGLGHSWVLDPVALYSIVILTVYDSAQQCDALFLETTSPEAGRCANETAQDLLQMCTTRRECDAMQMSSHHTCTYTPWVAANVARHGVTTACLEWWLLQHAGDPAPYLMTNPCKTIALPDTVSLQAIDDFHAAGNKHIPYTYVRGNSDYTHEPLKYDGERVGVSPLCRQQGSHGMGPMHGRPQKAASTVHMVKS